MALTQGLLFIGLMIGVGYLVVAWLVIQVASIGFPTFDAPPWALRVFILVALLGMNPQAAFPIMMGSCAFLMPIASARFIRHQCFDRRASLGLLVGGIPAENLTVHDFDVRTFPERRQDILELLVALWEEWRPDAVFHLAAGTGVQHRASLTSTSLR